MTKVSIIIPSRDRPASLVRAIDSIRATQGDHEVEIIVVLDEPDVASQEAMQQRSDVQVIVSGPGDAYLGKPQAKNNLGYAAATGEWFVTGTDDITFDSQGWIDECLRVNLGGMVGLSDGGIDPNWCCVLWMATKEYIDTVMRGYFGLPWYNVWWADVEWSHRAAIAGVYAPCTTIKLTHYHWARHNAPDDAIYALARTLVAADEKTFGRRQKRGFKDDLP